MITELVIDRSKWGRGRFGEGMLLRPDGKMCCLGFLGIACGISKDALNGKFMPIDAPSYRWPSATGEWYCDAAEINDNTVLPDSEREAALIERFKKVGIKLSFVDGT